MRVTSLCTLSIFLLSSALAIAENTVTVTVTDDVNATAATPTSTPTELVAVAQATTLGPSSTSSQVTNVEAAAAAVTTDSDSDSGQYVDTNAGASGSSAGSSFNLSNGGLIAIIVVVVLVVILGTVSIVLYILAKRRQWNVRASISRASRRLTGRGPKGQAPSRDRRTGVYAGGARKVSPSGVVAIKPPGHKRGLVVDVHDVEKGPLYSTAPINDGSKETWTKKLWGSGRK